jgi:L-amino acid N-acyltransferase YncA
MTIRMADPGDSAPILEIYKSYILDSVISFELTVPSQKEFAERIRHYTSEAPWLLCWEQNQLAGYAYASPHRSRGAYQWNREVSVYTNEQFKREGIASVLYQCLFDLLRVQGFSNALAGIVQPNDASVKFHKKMGFQLVGTYRNIGYKIGNWHSVSWYELFLQPPDFIPRQLIPTSDLIKMEKYKEVLKNGEAILSNRK